MIGGYAMKSVIEGSFLRIAVLIYTLLAALNSSGVGLVNAQRFTRVSDTIVREELGELTSAGTFNTLDSGQVTLPHPLYSATKLLELESISGRIVILQLAFDTMKGAGLLPQWTRSERTFPFATATYVVVCPTGGCDPNAPNIVSFRNLPSGSVGSIYSVMFKAAAGTAPYSWSRVSGAFPTGLTQRLSVISGMPSVAGMFVFRMRVTDGAGRTSEADFTIQISNVQTLPNLAPYKPSGWSDNIVVSTTTGTHTDGTQMNSDQTLYLDWAVANFSTASVTKEFSVRVFIDGELFREWYPQELKAQTYTRAEDQDIGKLQPGIHTIQLIADSKQNIQESDESDNLSLKTITILKGQSWNYRPYTPEGWPGSIVLSANSGDNIIDLNAYQNENLFIDWAVINDSTTSRALDVVIAINSVRYNSYSTGLLPPSGTYVIKDDNLGRLPLGTNHISIEIGRGLDESHYSDNDFSATITVKAGARPGTEHLPGLELWRFPTDGQWPCPAIGLTPYVYITAKDKLVAVNGSTGNKLWEFARGAREEFRPPSVGSNNAVFFHSANGKIYSLEGKTGQVRWEYVVPPGGFSGPVLLPDGALLVATGSFVVALKQETGEKLWERTFGSGVATAISVGNKDSGYFGSGKSLICIDTKIGDIRWIYAAPHNVESSPAIGMDAMVYAASVNGHAFAVDSMSGVEKWSANLGGGIQSSPIVSTDRKVFIGTSTNLFALDGRTGVRIWKRTAELELTAPALCGDGTLLVADFRSLLAVDSHDGTEKWRVPIPGTGYSGSPTINPDGIIFMQISGTLLAVDGKIKVGLAQAPWPKAFGNIRNSGVLSLMEMPSLEISNLNGRPVLSWPKLDFDLELYSTPSLAEAQTWTRNLEMPLLNGGRYVLTNKSPEPRMFYRLKKRQ